MELVAEASVSGSDTNILTCGGLDLDADKYYQIYVYVNASSGDPVIGWRANSVQIRLTTAYSDWLPTIPL